MDHLVAETGELLVTITKVVPVLVHLDEADRDRLEHEIYFSDGRIARTWHATVARNAERCAAERSDVAATVELDVVTRGAPDRLVSLVRYHDDDPDVI